MDICIIYCTHKIYIQYICTHMNKGNGTINYIGLYNTSPSLP